MKTLTRTIRFVVLGATVVAVVVSCCNYAFVAPRTIVPGTKSFAFVDIGSKERHPEYIEWKSQRQFDNALAQVCRHGVLYDLTVLLKDGADPIYPYKPCPSPERINTVKITRSKAAATAAGEPAPNDPNVMYRVQSPDPGDVDKVLQALK